MAAVKRLNMDCGIMHPGQKYTKTKTELHRNKTPRTEETPLPPPPPPLLPEDLHVPESSYADRIRYGILAWESVRQGLLQAYFDGCVPSAQETCIKCNKPVRFSYEHIRCSDCGIHAYFCSDKCATEVHQEGLLAFHKLDMWNVTEERYVVVNRIVYLVRSDHRCGNGQHVRLIQVYDQKGRHHLVNVAVCSCESDAITFMRHRLWATTVESPTIAFHMELLEWMEFLMLEAKVSLLGICQSIRWKNGLSTSEFNTLYKGIVGESFEQFRHLKYKVRTIGIEDDVTCPACPKDSGRLFISLDGNFGLVRKSNSGSSPFEPKHGEKLFVANNKVIGTYVDGPKDVLVSKTADCSNFQAGTNIRSKNKAAKLDVSGVFGSCCRHGVPHTFINMNKGEGLGYSLYVLDTLLEQLRGSNVKLHVLYDIACVLEKHLEAKGDSSRCLKDVSMAVPIFHVYGHKSACQVKYSTRWLDNYGLTDGEEMERLWAYLRRFSFITKEMTPAHRVDLLTDALLHYRRKKAGEIELALVKNLWKACEIRDNTTAELQEAQYKLGVSVSQVDEWIEDEKKRFSVAKETDEPFTKKERYVMVLQSMDSVVESLSECDDVTTRTAFNQQLTRLTKDAERLQTTIGSSRQWRRTDRQFKITKSSVEKKKKEKILKRLHTQAMDYRFIKDLRDKYSDGQAIGNRLTKNHIRASKGMKRSVNEYNANDFSSQSGNLPDQISWKDICNPVAEIYNRLECINQSSTSSDQIPSSERGRLIGVRNLNNRAEEEIGMTKMEMTYVLESLREEHSSIVRSIGNTNANIALQIVLRERSDKVRSRYIRCHSVFSKQIQTPNIPEQLRNPLDSRIDLSEPQLQEEVNVIDLEDPAEESEE